MSLDLPELDQLSLRLVSCRSGSIFRGRAWKNVDQNEPLKKIRQNNFNILSDQVV